ncbi:Uncharacterized protein FWK35_00027077, partial [Aphis craccivora]
MALSSLTSSFSRGGGALIAIRNDVVSNLICNPAINVEHVFVKFSYNHTNYVVCSVYFPPNSLISAYEAFMSTVQSVLLLHPDCVFIFCGDFNLPDVKWSNDDFVLSNDKRIYVLEAENSAVPCDSYHPALDIM